MRQGLALLSSCALVAAAPMPLQPAGDARAQWRGRYRCGSDGAAAFDWEGVNVRWSVSSPGAPITTGIVLVMPPGTSTRLSVFVDRGVNPSLSFLANASVTNYTLVAGLPPGQHNFTLLNEIEPAFIYGEPAVLGGSAGAPFYAPAPTLLSIWSGAGAFVDPSPAFAVKLMAIGDSLTSGFGAAGTAPCSANLHNNAFSATAVYHLCAHFAAECTGSIAWAGKGLLVNSPSSAGGPAMPEYVYQTLGTDSMTQSHRDWDFNRPSRPDVILINLLTNDCGKGGSACANATFADALVDAYVELVYNLTHVLHSGYPTIFLASGPVTTAYEGIVLRTIEEAKARRNLTNVHFVNYTGAPLDGCDGHPGKEGHAFMFSAAAAVIESVMGWKQGQGNAFPEVAPRPTAAAQVDASLSGAAFASRDPSRPRPRPTSLPFTHGASRNATGCNLLPGGGHVVNVTVRADGSGDYDSISAALTGCCTADTAAGELRPVFLHILGIFRERVAISSGFLGGVTIVGDGPQATDNLIAFNVSGAHTFFTFDTHSVIVQAAGVTLINVAVANDAGGYGPTAGQSVALHLAPTADKFACFGCMILGGVDTLYTGCTGYSLRSYFFDSFVNGSGDSIFGGSASVFEAVDLQMSFTVSAPRGEPALSAYLFLDSTVSAGGGSVLLARPWGQDSTEVWINTYLPSTLGRPGWSDWGHECDSTDWCRPLVFAEFNSSGPGASPATRVPWSRQLTATEAAAWTREGVLRGWQPGGSEGVRVEVDAFYRGE
jgi:pectinesterase